MNNLQSSFKNLDGLQEIYSDKITTDIVTTNSLNNIPAQTISYLDATSSIQSQLNYLYQSHTTSGGGIYVITGELTGGFVIGSYFNMEGATTNGIIVPHSYVYGIGIRCSQSNGSSVSAFDVYKNGSYLFTEAIGINLSNDTNFNFSAYQNIYSFNDGDYIQFRCGTYGSVGTMGTIKISLILATNGVQGARGDVGPTGPS